MYDDDHLELHIEGERLTRISGCDWDERNEITLDHASRFVLEAITSD